MRNLPALVVATLVAPALSGLGIDFIDLANYENMVRCTQGWEHGSAGMR